MTAERRTPLGRLSVSDEVVATLAARRAVSCPAVAGLARPAAPAVPLPPHRLQRGVLVRWSEEQLTVSLHVQARYGTSAAALNLAAQRVREAVAAALSLAPSQVRVEIKVVSVRGRHARLPLHPPASPSAGALRRTPPPPKPSGP